MLKFLKHFHHSRDETCVCSGGESLFFEPITCCLCRKGTPIYGLTSFYSRKGPYNISFGTPWNNCEQKQNYLARDRNMALFSTFQFFLLVIFSVAGIAYGKWNFFLSKFSYFFMHFARSNCHRWCYISKREHTHFPRVISSHAMK